ncbi:unnamed protein product [Auanema sp. JU1783]|nr:unnamed protein product [Auanema sp. JU1783]
MNSSIIDMLAFMITNVLICIFQTTTILLGTFVIYLFSRNIVLRNSGGLQLIFLLTICDVFAAITTIPYIVYLIVGWKPRETYYDPKTIVYISLTFVAQLKIHLTFTLSIAIDRSLAVYQPALYRRKNSKVYAMGTLCVAILFALFDISLELLIADYDEIPNCAAIGCFLDSPFLEYWGISNVVLGSCKLLLTLSVLVKLHRMHKSQSNVAWVTTGVSEKRFHQANKLSLMVMVVSACFITIPSISVGISEIFGFSLFSSVGPFYLLFLLIAATFNISIYLSLHKDVRRCMTAVWTHQETVSALTSTS